HRVSTSLFVCRYDGCIVPMRAYGSADGCGGWSKEGASAAGRKDQTRSRRCREVELLRQVAEFVRLLTHGRPGVRSAVGLRVEAGAAEEVVLDELQVRVEGERLVVDVATPGIRTDE